MLLLTVVPEDRNGVEKVLHINALTVLISQHCALLTFEVLLV